jgi:hypothetical protein
MGGYRRAGSRRRAFRPAGPAVGGRAILWLLLLMRAERGRGGVRRRSPLACACSSCWCVPSLAGPAGHADRARDVASEFGRPFDNEPAAGVRCLPFGRARPLWNPPLRYAPRDAGPELVMAAGPSGGHLGVADVAVAVQPIRWALSQVALFHQDGMGGFGCPDPLIGRHPDLFAAYAAAAAHGMSPVMSRSVSLTVPASARWLARGGTGGGGGCMAPGFIRR